MKAKPARLDKNRKAKPKTTLIARKRVGDNECYQASTANREDELELVNEEDGKRISVRKGS